MPATPTASFISDPVFKYAPPKKPMVTVPARATVQDALRLFKASNVLSLPVLGSNDEFMPAGGGVHLAGLSASDASRDIEGEVVGILSLLDVVYSLSSQPRENVPELLNQQCWKLIGNCIEGQSVWAVAIGEPMKTVLEPLSKGIHRMIVLGGEHPMILSQRDVLRGLAGCDKLAQFWGSSVESQFIFTKDNIVTASVSDSVSTCLRTMRSASVQALPVVDTQGVIVANFSASDVRAFGTDDLPSMLQQNVAAFLSMAHGDLLPAPVVCTPHAHMSQCLAAMLEGRMHRIWVVNSTGVPIGIVAMTDIIAAARKHLLE